MEPKVPSNREIPRGKVKERDPVEEKDAVIDEVMSRSPAQAEYTESFFSAGNVGRDQASPVSVKRFGNADSLTILACDRKLERLEMSSYQL